MEIQLKYQWQYFISFISNKKGGKTFVARENKSNTSEFVSYIITLKSVQPAHLFEHTQLELHVRDPDFE